MSFINTEVELSDLPLAEEVILHPINETYLKLLRTQWLIFSFFLSAVAVSLIVFIPELRTFKWMLLLAGGAFAIILFQLLLQEKSFPYRAFAVRQHDVIFRKGWLVQTIKICPFNRVQNCSIQSGVLERKWGLASLILYTAGTEGADMRIPGLQQTEAEQLRQFILSKINGTTV